MASSGTSHHIQISQSADSGTKIVSVDLRIVGATGGTKTLTHLQQPTAPTLPPGRCRTDCVALTPCAWLSGARHFSVPGVGAYANEISWSIAELQGGAPSGLPSTTARASAVRGTNGMERATILRMNSRARRATNRSLSSLYARATGAPPSTQQIF